MTGNRIWLFGAALATVAILILGWLVGVSPKLGEASQAMSDTASVRAQNLDQEARLATLRDQFERLDEFKAHLDVLRIAIPDAPDLEDFYDFLQNASVSAGVVIKSITAAEASQYGTVAGAPATPAEPTTPAPTDSSTPVPGTATPPPPAPASSDVYTVRVEIVVTGAPLAVIAFSKIAQLGKRFFLSTALSYDESTVSGTVTGYLFVIPSPDIPLFQKPKPTPAPTPTPTPTPAPTDEPTDEPTPTPTPTG